MNFGDRLRYWREHAGMTQEQLGLALGRSGQSTIANYEARTDKPREPRLDEIRAISNVLRVPLVALVDDDAFEQHRRAIDAPLLVIDGGAQAAKRPNPKPKRAAG